MPGRGCFIAANLGLSLIAIMATSTALRTIVEGMSSIVLAALRQGTAMCYNVSTALRTIVETMMFVSGCVVFILRKLTAMCYGTAALCALIIKWVLLAWCARMYFFTSALRGLAISWLSIAFCTTITAALQVWRFVVCILPLFLTSELVGYAISLDYMDYKAAVAVVCDDLKAALVFGVAIGIAPRIPIWLLACIVDAHITISLMITSIIVRASNFIVKAMKNFRVLMIYRLLAVLGLVILFINVIVAAMFVVAVRNMAYQNIVPIMVFVVVLWMLALPVYCFCRHLLLYYLIAIAYITVVVLAIEGYMPLYAPMLAISVWVCLLQCTAAIERILPFFQGYTPQCTRAIERTLSFFLDYMLTMFIVITFECIDLLATVYSWTIKKNYTLRWRRLLLYGGQSYRSILMWFAWLFQARPLYIACFFICLCIMSKLAITSPMKRQLDPLEMWRDMRQSGNTMNVPIPHVIFLSLCNILMGASIWRMVLSGFTISAWWFNCHFQENYCKAISPALTIILAWECSWYDLAILTHGEAMKPTFGKRAYKGDTPMPGADASIRAALTMA